MSKLKSNIENISGDAEHIIKEYKKLISIWITEKLSLVLGILLSVLIILTLLLVVVVILSFALAGFINELLDSEFVAYLIVAGLYLIIIALLIIRMVRSETPLLSNLFVKFMLSILEIDVNQNKTIKGLEQEKENVNDKIELSREKLKSDFQLLKYSLLDGLLKEFFGLFTKKKKSGKAAPSSTKTRNKTKKKAVKGN